MELYQKSKVDKLQYLIQAFKISIEHTNWTIGNIYCKISLNCSNYGFAETTYPTVSILNPNNFQIIYSNSYRQSWIYKNNFYFWLYIHYSTYNQENNFQIKMFSELFRWTLFCEIFAVSMLRQINCCNFLLLL